MLKLPKQVYWACALGTVLTLTPQPGVAQSSSAPTAQTADQRTTDDVIKELDAMKQRIAELEAELKSKTAQPAPAAPATRPSAAAPATAAAPITAPASATGPGPTAQTESRSHGGQCYPVRRLGLDLAER